MVDVHLPRVRLIRRHPPDPSLLEDVLPGRERLGARGMPPGVVGTVAHGRTASQTPLIVPARDPVRKSASSVVPHGARPGPANRPARSWLRARRTAFIPGLKTWFRSSGAETGRAPFSSLTAGLGTIETLSSPDGSAHVTKHPPSRGAESPSPTRTTPLRGPGYAVDAFRFGEDRRPNQLVSRMAPRSSATADDEGASGGVPDGYRAEVARDPISVPAGGWARSGRSSRRSPARRSG